MALSIKDLDKAYREQLIYWEYLRKQQDKNINAFYTNLNDNIVVIPDLPGQNLRIPLDWGNNLETPNDTVVDVEFE